MKRPPFWRNPVTAAEKNKPNHPMFEMYELSELSRRLNRTKGYRQRQPDPQPGMDARAYPRGSKSTGKKHP